MKITNHSVNKWLALLVAGIGIIAASAAKVSATGTTLLDFGGPGWTAVIGDYDGDGYADPTIYQPATGTWKVLASAAQGAVVTWMTGFGDTNLTAILGDYDGDRKADPMTYDAARADWNIKLSGSGYATISWVNFLGGLGWAALAPDFDGDGLADPTTYDSASSSWEVRLSSAGYYMLELSSLLGGPGWAAVAADFDGDRRDDLAVYQELTGNWQISASDSGYTTISYPALLGGPGYQALGGDYDGNGSADFVVYQESSGRWEFLFTVGVVRAPTGVAASDGNYTDRVRISWEAVATATGYEVWRNTTNTFVSATLMAEGLSATNYTDSNVVVNTMYYYLVRATNSTAKSDFSAGDAGFALSGPVVLANGMMSADLTLPVGEEVSIALSYGAGTGTADQADWWVVALAGADIYFLNSLGQWQNAPDISHIRPIYQGTLFDLRNFTIIDNWTPFPGVYDFYFGVDARNGILDADLVYDHVTVSITP
ncbi:MAG: fibronectin type III domain-containing protein [Lentisphaerae bacterium]|nr:fibronectin type III domain-containing protein [Lentisphaerota bacterium]